MPKDIYACQFCNKKHQTIQSLRSHELRCKENPNRRTTAGQSINVKYVTCEYCDKTVSQNVYSKHLKSCEKNPEVIREKSVECRFCREIFIAVKWKKDNRFCSQSCAAKFNNAKRWKNKKRKIILRRPRIGLLERDFDTILSHSARRRRVITEQQCRCLECGISEWNNKPIVLEMDHIDGNVNNNARSNLRALCPNCHSQTPTWRGRKIKFQTEEDSSDHINGDHM